MINRATKEIRLLSLTTPHPDLAMTMDHEAECRLRETPSFFTRLTHGKGSPANFCRCGFYAYNDKIDAARHYQGSVADSGDFLLTVVGSGKMIEYTKGYRYSHQRIAAIETLNCMHDLECNEKADRVFVSSWLGPTPICQTHSIDILRYPDNMGRYYLMTFAEMETAINAFAPVGLPHITVSSFCDDIVPWDGVNNQPVQDPLFSIYA